VTYRGDLVKGAKTDAAAFAHMTGYQGEVRVAADAVNRGETVVSWGGKVGSQGADVISVNPKTGEVILYDAKTYSNATNVQPSPTFAPGSDALINARDQAERAISASNLPPAIEQQALKNIREGNFTTRTTNQGMGGSSPIAVKFCGHSVCP
jgi:filamentous hemagglutinin